MLSTAPLTDLDGASAAISNGATFASIAATAIDESNVGGATLSADGAGTTLDLHTVRALTFGGGNYNAVTATNGGTVDLSGLTAVRRSVYYSHLTFTAAGGGTLKLPNLQTVDVDSAGSNGVQTYFTLGPGAASVSVPALQQMHFARGVGRRGTDVFRPRLNGRERQFTHVIGRNVIDGPAGRH